MRGIKAPRLKTEYLPANLLLLWCVASSYIQSMFESWEMLVRTKNNNANISDFSKAHADLQKKLNMAEKIANELTRSVDLVEQKPLMFSHITPTELVSRKRFLQQSKQTLARIKQALHSAPAAPAALAQENTMLTGTRTATGTGGRKVSS